MAASRKDFFSRVFRVAGEIPWGTFAEVMSQNLGATTDVAQEIIEQIKEWGGHLTKNALEKWIVSVAMPVECESPDVASGRPKPCHSYAVARCDICGRNCCLAHARVDFMADAICEVCIGTAKAQARAGVAGYSRAQSPRQPPPAAKGMSVDAALKTLKLGRRASWGQIKSRYRKLVVEHNADRPQSDAEREQNTARLKKINEAYSVLREHYEKSEAA